MKLAQKSPTNKQYSVLSQWVRLSNRNWFSAVLAVCFSAGVPLMAAAQGNDQGSIFSTPNGFGGQVPAFGPGQRRGHRQKNRRSQVPTLKEIRMIPSLTPQQRQQIVQVYKGARADMGPMMQEVRALAQQAKAARGCPGEAGGCAGGRRKGRFGGGSGVDASNPEQAQIVASAPSATGIAAPGRGPGAGGAMLDPETREKLRSLRQQLQTKRAALWQQVQAMLTPEQLNELAMMRKGQLMRPGLDAQ